MSILATVRPPVVDGEAAEETRSAATSLDKLRARFATEPFTRAEATLAFLAAFLLFAVVTAMAAGRQLWYDELFTYYIAKSATLGQMWQAMRLDQNPPLIYLLVRASMAVFGDNTYAVRLPSTVAFLVGSFSLYRFVGRRLRPEYGMVAMLAFWASPFLYYATEARPYALVIGFFGLAMLAWQRAVEETRSPVSVGLLGLALTGTMLSHYFAVFALVPFGMAELFRWHRRRRFDLALWVALSVPLLTLAVFRPNVSRYETGVFPWQFQASPEKMMSFFTGTLDPESMVLLLALGLGVTLVFRREGGRIHRSSLLRPVELVFAASLAVIPVLLNASLMLQHRAFFPRYAAAAVLLYPILFAAVLAMQTNRSRLAAAAACCVLVVQIGFPQLVMGGWNQFRSRNQPRAGRPSDPVAGKRPELPVVAASGLTFLELDKYADPSTVSRLYYLTDPELAVEYAHATIFENYPDVKRYFPIRGRVEAYREFVAQHPQFLVLGTPGYAEDWLIRCLLDGKAKLEYLGEFPSNYKDSQVYEVTMMGS